MPITVLSPLMVQLKIVESPDFEIKSSYSARLQTTDSGGLTHEKEVTMLMMLMKHL